MLPHQTVEFFTYEKDCEESEFKEEYIDIL
jgi:hypothetical protein